MWLDAGGVCPFAEFFGGGFGVGPGAFGELVVPFAQCGDWSVTGFEVRELATSHTGIVLGLALGFLRVRKGAVDAGSVAFASDRRQPEAVGAGAAVGAWAGGAVFAHDTVSVWGVGCHGGVQSGVCLRDSWVD